MKVPSLLISLRFFNSDLRWFRVTAGMLVSSLCFAQAETDAVHFDVNTSSYNTVSKLENAGWNLSHDQDSSVMFELQQTPAFKQAFMIGGDLTQAPLASHDFEKPLEQGMVQALIVTTSSFSKGRLGLRDADGNILYAHHQVSPRNFQTELGSRGMDQDVQLDNFGSTNARNAVDDYETGYGIVTVRWTEDSVSWSFDSYYSDGQINETYSGENGQFFAGGPPASIFISTSKHDWPQRKFGFVWLTYSDDPNFEQADNEPVQKIKNESMILTQRHFDLDESDYNSMRDLKAWGWSFAGQLEEIRNLAGTAGINNFLYLGGDTASPSGAMLHLGGTVDSGSLDLTVFTRSSAAQGRVELLDEDMNVLFAFIPQSPTRFWTETQGETLPVNFDIPNNGSNDMMNTPEGYSHVSVDWDSQGHVVWSWTHYRVNGSVNHEKKDNVGSFLLSEKKPSYLVIKTLLHNHPQRAIGVADISITMFDKEVVIEAGPSEYRELTPQERSAFVDFRNDLQDRSRQTVKDSQVDTLLKDFSKGRFSNLAYDQADDAEIHFKNLTQFIHAYQNPASRHYRSTNMADNVAEGFDFWISKDYQDSNWWHNIIGFQRRMNTPAILFADVLEADYPEIYEAVVAYFRKNFEYMLSDRRGGGTNLADMSYNAIISALFAWDITQLEHSRELFTHSIAIREPGGDVLNGVYPDMTHLEHGPQFHNASYGHEFLKSLVNTLKLLNGSAWDLPQESYELAENLFLDGIAHMTYGRWFDFNAGGRSITRMNSHSVARNFAQPLAEFLQFETERIEELRLLHDRLLSAPTSTNNVDATKSFLFSEFISHIRPDYYSSVRLVSERTQRNESGNNEGRKNRHFGDGINFVLVHGNEYDYMPAIWNYERLPGLTAEQAGNFLPEKDWGVFGSNRYAGTLTNGRQGLAAMKLEHDGLSAKKSYFLFDDAIVALGSNINGGSTQNPVYTTLNQTRRFGEVLYGNNEARQTIEAEQSGRFALNRQSWIWHNDIGYILPAGNASAYIETETITGNYNTVGNSDYEVTQPVITLWVDHGASPSDGQYSYIILPATSAAKTEAFVSDPRVNILLHTEEIHAVAHPDSQSIGIVFFKEGRLKITDRHYVVADAPALVMVRQDLGQLQLTYSDPEQRDAPVKIEVGHVKGEVD